MKILFDSHALVWFLRGDRRLPARVRARLEPEDTEFIISAVCIWEIATKVARGRWPEAAEIISVLEETLAARVHTPLPITLEHARVAGFLPNRHRDPFDRMLAAQAQIEGVPLLTADPVFRDFGVHVIW